MSSSNTCPKCGGKCIKSSPNIKKYNCGTTRYLWNGKHSIDVGIKCTKRDFFKRGEKKGRAEAIAELDAWHTVSDVEPSIKDGQCIVVKTQNNNGKWYSILRRVSHCWETDYGEPLSWRDVSLAVNSETTKQWRGVRP